MEVVIAIKLGTNYSTNAYMKSSGYGEDQKMFTVPFRQQTVSQLSITTPTVALFTERGELEAYGFEAELKHAVPGKSENHMLFREFIWNLFSANDTVPENLESHDGRSMKSLDILSSVLTFMVDHVKSETGEMIDQEPIHFKHVFTLPTCSCAGARTFMTQAAEKAGFPLETLTIVEEAAAALCVCLQKSPEDLVPEENQERMFLMVECEDDNVHISILRNSENAIEIKYERNAEVWASCQIQKDFVEMFSLITGESFLSYFFEKYPIEYLELLEDLKKKIKITSPDTSRVAVKMSALLLEKMKKKSGKDIQKAAKQTGLADTVEFKMDKCFISSETFKSLFTDAGKNIVDFVENSTISKYPDINHVVLVGEFAQSRILQDIIRSAFPSKRIHIPQDANMAAVKGALLMGQTDVTVVRSQDFQRERTQILSDTNPLGEVAQSPRAFREAPGATTKSKTKNSPAKPTPVNRSEKRNQSRLCVIQ